MVYTLIPFLPSHAMITNLMTNALKFTDGGAITIGYALQPDNMLEFYVSDT